MITRNGFRPPWRTATACPWACRVDALGGGDTGATFRVDLDGRPAFLKWLPDGDALDAEADGLAALATAIRVPEVLDHGDLAGGRGLLLEWLPMAAPGESFWPAFGRALAALHGVEGERFGHHRDNWIGANPQYNRSDTDWARFFVDQRLAPQLRWARDRGLDAALVERLERVMARVAVWLKGLTIRPVRVHGDLWRGNVGTLAGDRPVVFDPAVYTATPRWTWPCCRCSPNRRRFTGPTGKPPGWIASRPALQPVSFAQPLQSVRRWLCRRRSRQRRLAA